MVCIACSSHFKYVSKHVHSLEPMTKRVFLPLMYKHPANAATAWSQRRGKRSRQRLPITDAQSSSLYILCYNIWHRRCESMSHFLSNNCGEFEHISFYNLARPSMPLSRTIAVLLCCSLSLFTTTM